MSESRDNVFATAIKILENKDLDYRSLVFSMASVSPEALIKAVAESEVEPDSRGGLVVGVEAQRMREEINDLARNDKPVQAIKQLRAYAKLGLKEAKDIVDTITTTVGIPTRIPMYKQNEEPLW